MKKRILSYIFLVFLMPFYLFAQNQSFKVGLTPDKKIPQFLLEKWTSDNGLPSSTVLHIMQSSKGYLWFSTYNGLIKFDGKKMTVFGKKDFPKLKTNGFDRFVEDKKGNFWAGTQGNGLLKFNENGEYQIFSPKDIPSLSIYTILIDNKGTIWAGAVDKWLFIVKEGRLEVVKHPQLINISILDIIQDKSGAVWIATEGNGLIRFKDDKFRGFTTKDGLNSNVINRLFSSKANDIWIGSNSGLNRWKDGEITNNQDFEKYDINDLLIDGYHNFWFATEQGLLRKNTHTNEIEEFSESKGLPNKELTSLLFDHENSLWIGSYRGGLFQLKEGKFTTYNKVSGLSNEHPNVICELGDDNYLIGLNNGKINQMKNGEISDFSTKTKFPNTRIRDIKKDSKGNLWISFYGGLLKIAPNKKETLFDVKSGFPNDRIRFTFEDKKKNIWVGTRLGLIKLNENGKHIVIGVKDGLEAELIMSITEGKKGNIWIGTDRGGLSSIKNNKIVKTYNNELPGNVVFNTSWDQRGALWVCTNGGLARIYEGKVTNITTKNGLPVDAYFDFLEDNSGYVWLPSSIGIVRLSKQELEDFLIGKSKKVNYRIYNKNDGVGSNECVSAVKSLKDSQGSLWIPTMGGVSVINPNNIPVNAKKPPVLITKMIADYDAIDLQKNIVLDANVKRIKFSFTALSLLAANDITFKYQLEGFDENWIDSGHTREVSYTSLPHGEYTFKVLASNSDGIWSKTEAKTSFYLQPHIYETYPFYFVIFLIGILVIWQGVRLRTAAIKSKNKELEILVLERTSEIRQQTEEIREQKDNIEIQKNEIVTQSESLSKAQVIIQQQNDKLHDANISLEKKVKMRTEQLNLALKELDHFVYRSAHDLRGPITRLLGLSNLGKMEAKEEAALQYFDFIQNVSENMIGVLSRLIRIHEIKGRETEISTIPMKKNVQDIIALLSSKENIDFKINIDDNLVVETDLFLLNIILENIIQNAIQYRKPRRDAAISIAVQLNEENQIYIVIRDAGIGIPKGIKNKVFDMFFKGTEISLGAGLGLYEVKFIVKLLKGTIKLRETDKQETAFSIFLPPQIKLKMKN